MQYFKIFKTEKSFLIFLVVLVIFSFIFWAQKSFGEQVVVSDASYYDRVAVNVLEGEGFTDKGDYQSTMAPGYPLFLAGIYYIFGHNLDVVRVIQGTLFVGIALFSYFLSKGIFNEKIARMAGILTALYYALPISAGNLQREVILSFFIMLLAYCLYRLYENQNAFWSLMVGLSTGTLTLVNGVTRFLFIPVLVAIIFIFAKKVDVKKIALNSFIFLASFFVIFGAQMIYNYSKTSSVGLSNSGGGLYARAEIMDNLSKNYFGHLIGMSFGYYFTEKIYADINPRLFRDVPESDKKIDELKAKGYSDHQLDKTMFESGKQKVLSNLDKYFAMSFLDFISFNSPIIPHGEKWELNFIHLTFAGGRYSEMPEILKAGYLLTLRFLWFAFFSFIIYAFIVETKKDWRKLGFVFIILLYMNAIYSLTHAIPRYAIPIYPLYIILFSAGIFVFLSKYFKLKDVALASKNV